MLVLCSQVQFSRNAARDFEKYKQYECSLIIQVIGHFERNVHYVCRVIVADSMLLEITEF